MNIELDCIPPIHSVQKLNFEKIKNEAKLEIAKDLPADQQIESDEEVSDFRVEYEVLPLWNSVKRNMWLKKWVCMDKNPYLRCRWKKFLENVPRTPLFIKIYKINPEPTEPPPVRRMMLTGQLYGKDAKTLNPIPYYRDARQ